MADGKFSNRSNRDAKDFSLVITDKPNDDISVGSLTSGYYTLTAKDITGTMTAGTVGRFSSASATDASAVVGRIKAASFSGGGLTTTNYSGTPTVSIATETNMAAATEGTTKGTYYVEINSSSNKLTGTTTVKRAAVTSTAGYQPTSSAVISAGSASPSVTVNAGSAETKYINIPAGGCSISGGDLSGGSAVTPTVSMSISAQTTAGASLSNTKPSNGYYLTIAGSSSKGSSTVTRADIKDTHTAGYIPAKSATTVIASTTKTVTVNAGSQTSYITIPTGSCTVSGGDLSGGSAVTPTVSMSISAQTTTGVTLTDTTPGKEEYYLTVVGSSSKGSSTVTRTNITDTHTAGYIPAKSATTVIASTTKTVTVNENSKKSYIKIPAAAWQPVTDEETKVTTVDVTTAGYIPAKTIVPAAAYKNGFVTTAGYIKENENIYKVSTLNSTDECIEIIFNE